LDFAWKKKRNGKTAKKFQAQNPHSKSLLGELYRGFFGEESQIEIFPGGFDRDKFIQKIGKKTTHQDQKSMVPFSLI